MSNYFAVCARGVEPVLEHELRSLGISQTKSLFSGVAFEGEIDDLYRTNMALRTATRVLKPVAEFIARDFDALYRGVRKIDMYELFRVDQTFR
ncbi:MAG: hypothetical protein CO167_07710, partial [Candidatus Marinimicrobia bacterium CG_4_9_14_3_um_filter_48_9]